MKTASIKISGKRSSGVKLLATFASKQSLETKATAYVLNAGKIMPLSYDSIIVDQDNLDDVAAELTDFLTASGQFRYVEIHGVTPKVIEGLEKFRAARDRFHAAVQAGKV